MMKKIRFHTFSLFFVALFTYFCMMCSLASASPNMVYVGNNPTMKDIRCNLETIEIVDPERSLVSIELVGVLNDETAKRYVKQMGLKKKPFATVNTMVIDFNNLTFTYSLLMVVDKGFNILYAYEPGLGGGWENIGKSGFVYNTSCKVFDVINRKN